MGIDYRHHTMVGVFIRGQMEDLYAFLEDHGFPFTEEEKEQIYENGSFSEDIVEMLELEDMDIVNLNGWSGHDYIIGFHVKNKRKTKEFANKFAKYFPNLKPDYEVEFHDFTEVC